MHSFIDLVSKHILNGYYRPDTAREALVETMTSQWGLPQEYSMGDSQGNKNSK